MGVRIFMGRGGMREIGQFRIHTLHRDTHAVHTYILLHVHQYIHYTITYYHYIYTSTYTTPLIHIHTTNTTTLVYGNTAQIHTTVNDLIVYLIFQLKVINICSLSISVS